MREKPHYSVERRTSSCKMTAMLINSSLSGVALRALIPHFIIKVISLCSSSIWLKMPLIAVQTPPRVRTRTAASMKTPVYFRNFQRFSSSRSPLVSILALGKEETLPRAVVMNSKISSSKTEKHNSSMVTIITKHLLTTIKSTAKLKKSLTFMRIKTIKNGVTNVLLSTH